MNKDIRNWMEKEAKFYDVRIKFKPDSIVELDAHVSNSQGMLVVLSLFDPFWRVTTVKSHLEHGDVRFVVFATLQ